MKKNTVKSTAKREKRGGRKPRTAEQIESRVFAMIDEDTRIVRDKMNFIIEKKQPAGKNSDGSKKYVWFGKCYFSNLLQLYKHLIENVALSPECPVHNIVNEYNTMMAKIDEFQRIAIRDLKEI